MTKRKIDITEDEVLDIITAKEADGGTTYAGLSKIFKHGNLATLRAILRKLLADEAISVQRVQGGQVKYRRIHPCPALALLYSPPRTKPVVGTRRVDERMPTWNGRHGQIAHGFSPLVIA